MCAPQRIIDWFFTLAKIHEFIALANCIALINCTNPSNLLDMIVGKTPVKSTIHWERNKLYNMGIGFIFFYHAKLDFLGQKIKLLTWKWASRSFMLILGTQYVTFG